MLTYGELVELARICAKNAHVSTTVEVARELWKMANEYRAKAMALGGEPVDIGLPPARLHRID
jgi:hypothetical protein